MDITNLFKNLKRFLIGINGLKATPMYSAGYKICKFCLVLELAEVGPVINGAALTSFFLCVANLI